MSQEYGPPSIVRAVGEAHAVYRHQRTAFDPPDERIGEAVSWSSLKPHALRFVVFYALFLLLTPLWLFFRLLAGVTSLVDSVDGGGSVAGGFFSFLAAIMGLLMLGLVVAWLVSLFLPVREGISEHSVVVPDAAPALTGAFAWMLQASRDRQVPFEFRGARLAGAPVLQVAHGRVRALILVRAVGADLYVGWSMWRSRPTIVVLGHLLRDVFRRFGDEVDARVDLPDGEVRALREVVHGLAREAGQAALLRLNPPTDLEQEIRDLPEVGSGSRPASPWGPPSSGS